jgi:hypothetical protein
MEKPLTLSETISCSRATNGYVDNKAGVWSLCTGNVPRVSDRGLLVEFERTNLTRNNSMQGAVVGAPGVDPTFWSISASTKTIVAKGTDSNGGDYIDIRFQGGNGQHCFINPDSVRYPASAGQHVTFSVFTKIVAGSLTNLAYQTCIDPYDGGGVLIGGGDFQVQTVTATLTRISETRTMPANTASVTTFVRLIATGAYDVTLRFTWPQSEKSRVATSPIRTTNATATRARDVITVIHPSEVINPLEQTIFFEMTPLINPSLADAPLVQAGWHVNGFANSAYAVTENIVNGRQGIGVVSDGVEQIVLPVIATQPMQRYKAAMALAPNQMRGAMNGMLGALDSDAAMPVGQPTRVVIGSAPWAPGDNLAMGYYHKVWFIPSREADEFLIYMTKQFTPPSGGGSYGISSATGVAVADTRSIVSAPGLAAGSGLATGAAYSIARGFGRATGVSV